MDVMIALFRGINVGGSNRLSMKDLKATLERLGARNVATYIQSGNVVFQSDARDWAGLAERIAREIESSHGFRPHVVLVRPSRVERAIASNPFPEAESEPKSLHVFFLESEPRNPDHAKLAALQGQSERCALDGNLFYLHAPDGIARSKLAAGAEKALGVPATARNWRTVCKIHDMARELESGS